MKVTGSLVTIVTNRVLRKSGGDEYIGIMTIISTLQDVLFLFVFAMGDGAKPVLSYNFGAKEYKKIKKAIYYLTVVFLAYTALVTVVMLLFADTIAGFFTVDPLTISRTAAMIKIYFCIFVFTAFQSTGQNFFQAVGEAKYAIFYAVFRKMGLVIPFLFLLPIKLGTRGVFLANPLSEVISGVMCYGTMLLFYKRYLGERERIDED